MCMQLLATSTSRKCPLDHMPLQHASIERYRPNYTVMSMVEAGRDSKRDFKLRAGQLKMEMLPATILGRGGGGIVLRGALAADKKVQV